MITSSSVVSAEAYRAIPDKDKKKWTQAEMDAETQAKAASDADIAAAHQHLVVRAALHFESCTADSMVVVLMNFDVC
eukprot:COSAG02_NODE_46353_length_349_cov_1.240000_2_plen_76_part_01